VCGGEKVKVQREPENVTSLEGAVELINGRLTLSIPLAEGGDQFVVFNLSMV
jgi:hypothetical protein